MREGDSASPSWRISPSALKEVCSAEPSSSGGANVQRGKDPCVRSARVLSWGLCITDSGSGKGGSPPP